MILIWYILSSQLIGKQMLVYK